jgi:acyl carrier protein
VNAEQARTVVLHELHQIAPEAELDQLSSNANLREELDIDSMDFLNFAIGIEQETGIEIPERDYPKISTLADTIRYLVSVSGG